MADFVPFKEMVDSRGLMGSRIFHRIPSSFSQVILTIELTLFEHLHFEYLQQLDARIMMDVVKKDIEYLTTNRIQVLSDPIELFAQSLQFYPHIKWEIR